jgi:hypothetical protein
MAGCRVQQTYRVSCGANRRSRVERQGRNVCGAWQLYAEGGFRFSGSGREVSVSVEGRSLNEPHERSPERTV